MPIYQYNCKDCGPFTNIQSIKRWADPVHCPHCEQSSERTVSTPQIANMDGYQRIAHQRNEKSADEPRMERRSSHEHTHPHNHHPSATHKHGPSRPWMIGH